MEGPKRFAYQLYSSIGSDSERNSAFAWRLVSPNKESSFEITKTIRDDLNILIERGEIADAIGQFQDLMKTEDEDLVTQIKTQYLSLQKLESDYRATLIGRDDYNVRMNRIIYWLLHLINQQYYDPTLYEPVDALAHDGEIVKKHVRQQIRKEELYTALGSLKTYLDGADDSLYTTVIQLISRYQRARRDNSNGILNSSQYNSEVSEISDNILELLGNLPEFGKFVDGLPAVEESREDDTQPEAWIYIKGTTDKGRYENNPILENIADEFGRKLADTNFGLIIRSWRGVNAATFSAFVRARKLKKKQVNGYVKMLADSDIELMFRETSKWSDEIVSDELYMPGDVLEFADSCVAIGHTGTVRSILRAFREKEKPVLPILYAFGEGMTLLEFESFYLKLDEKQHPKLEGHYKDSIDRILSFLKDYDWSPNPV